MIKIDKTSMQVSGEQPIVLSELTSLFVEIASKMNWTPSHLMERVIESIQFSAMCRSGMSPSEAMSIMRNKDIDKEDMDVIIEKAHKMMEKNDSKTNP